MATDSVGKPAARRNLDIGTTTSSAVYYIIRPYPEHRILICRHFGGASSRFATATSSLKVLEEPVTVIEGDSWVVFILPAICLHLCCQLEVAAVVVALHGGCERSGHAPLA